ncbi:uncharacterized protein LOC108228695 [Kryptolebias marmoratus]|uniref:uncharacterized protein LOC108228695 n=1 Tax=Kryptolebias marmoratus TaxID=37003 RepID=UPI0018ACD352|nr:uncharacterized protein LOC108228695 [Kryptolebias marmoratus]
MGVSECCVRNCGSSSHDSRGRKLLDGLTFHCFPAWRTEEGGFVSELTRRRRAAWVAAVGRSDITYEHVPSSMRVCSRHFHSGKPAFEMLDLDPDWVPSLHLGQDGDGNSGKKRRRAADDCGLGLGRPAPWTEVRSALQVLLQEKPVSQELRGETSGLPAGTRKDTGFRDFFRNALESSLEASIQSRTQSRNQSSSTKYEVELSFKLPLLDGEPSTGKESTSCKNCSQLLRRIRKLERHLFQLATKQDRDGLESSLVQMDQDQDQQTCERTQDVSTGMQDVFPGTEDVSPGTEDVSPGTEDVFPGTQDVFPGTEDVSLETEDVFPWTGRLSRGAGDDSSMVLSSEMAPLSPDSSSLSSDTFSPEPTPSGAGSSPPPHLRRRPRRRPRFRTEWLDIFPFIRYSPTLDVMWCHVCRVHSDGAQRNHSLISGSRSFQRTNLQRHGRSFYHQQNVTRQLARSGPGSDGQEPSDDPSWK